MFTYSLKYLSKALTSGSGLVPDVLFLVSGIRLVSPRPAIQGLFLDMDRLQGLAKHLAKHLAKRFSGP